MAVRPKKQIIVEEEESSTNANTPLIQKLLNKQLEHSLMISNLTNDLTDTKKIVSKILFHIENDDRTGQKGMVARLHDVEKKVDDHDIFKNNFSRLTDVEKKVEVHELFKNNFEGRMWALSAAGGFIASLIAYIVTKILSQHDL